MKSYSESYREAGVDITAGYQAVELMKKHIARTENEGVLTGVGGFGGLFRPDLKGMEEPILVSGTDGVGTKLKLAFLMDSHDTVGIDCVAMCVNDVICCGAKPLFFLDYIACGKNSPNKIESIVLGIAEGCVMSGAALIGGETAEMPGFYPEEEYDLAGFTVGMVDRKKMVDNQRMKAGDKIIALPSSGVHSNGFSLIRKIFGLQEGGDKQVQKETLARYYDELGCSLGTALLRPTKIYVKPVTALLLQVDALGISHITGGGFYENIPRSLKEGLTARIYKKDIKIPPIFNLIQKTGQVPERDMMNTFNMGVGMTIVVPEKEVQKSLAILNENGAKAYLLGDIIEGDHLEIQS